MNADRDANQLAADVPEVRAALEMVRALRLELPAAVADDVARRVDELVALVGTLQQERDEWRDLAAKEARAGITRDKERMAAEAALADLEMRRRGEAESLRFWREQAATTRQALADFATHGTRYDCNPTVMWPTSEIHFWWVERATAMDNAVRERARRALADTGGVS